MWVRYTNDGKIEDLHFTVTLTHKCNLACKYCHLINQDISISYENIDAYVSFFKENESEIYQYCKNIVFIFFWWEPILEYKKILYFIEKLYFLKSKFVIYTNWVLLNEDIIDMFTWFSSKRVIFYFSIDGSLNHMLNYRLSTEKQYENILHSVSVLKSKKFPFSITKVIIQEKSSEIFESFKFLHSLSPVKLDFQPVFWFYHHKYSQEYIKEIIKWLNLFIEYLKKNWYSELKILEYMWLPDNVEWFKTMYSYYPWFYCDVENHVYWLLDGLPLFDYNKSFTPDEILKIELGTIWKDNTFILDILKNYSQFESDMSEVWEVRFQREFSNEIELNRLLRIFFIKKLLVHKYKPQNVWS